MLYICVMAKSSPWNDLLKPQNQKYLFIGDSQTNTNANNFSQLLMGYLGIINPNQVKVLQKDGALTSWMKLALIQELSKNQYDYVVIWGGYNDMYGKTQPSQAKFDVVKNLQDMVALVRRSTGANQISRSKAVVINMHCDRLRSPSLRFANNEKEMDSLYKMIQGQVPANYVVPTRAITGGCVTNANQLISRRGQFCQPNDKLCHLNRTGNEAIAKNIYYNYLMRAKW
jgi:lysophospholipase L1-like esterase